MPTKNQRKRNRKTKENKERIGLSYDSLIVINELFLCIYLPKIKMI